MRKLALLLLVPVVLMAATPAVATHSLGWRWHVRSPFVLYIDAQITDPGLDAALAFGMSSWSQSSVVDLVPGTKGRVKVSVFEGNYGAGYPAWVSLDIRNGYIASAIIYLNDYYLLGQSDDSKRYSVCQELGHALGLDHQDSPTSPTCMSGMWPGPTPNAHDFEELELIYG